MSGSSTTPFVCHLILTRFKHLEMGLNPSPCGGGQAWGGVCCLCVSWAGWPEQVATARHTEWAAEAAASRAGEISWEIDTDKSSTLRLPGGLGGPRRRPAPSPGSGCGFL